MACLLVRNMCLPVEGRLPRCWTRGNKALPISQTRVELTSRLLTQTNRLIRVAPTIESHALSYSRDPSLKVVSKKISERSGKKARLSSKVGAQVRLRNGEMLPGRPTLDDVDRLSQGQRAKKRGTGSRVVPHRLNEEEMMAFQLSKMRGYLIVSGTGKRRNRRLGNNNPAYNIYRQYCDVFGWPAIILEQGTGSDKPDSLMVDTSPTRLEDQSDMQREMISIAEGAGLLLSLESAEDSDVVHIDEDEEEDEASETVSAPTPEEFAAVENHIAEQGAAIVDLKASGLKNADPEVKAQVEVLLQWKAKLEELNASVDEANELNTSAEEDELSRLAELGPLRIEGAIWQLPTTNISFDCPEGRQQARDVAKLLAMRFCIGKNKYDDDKKNKGEP
mmetsp:Transcript_23442/g.39219  ORF Transcript_23442/g.39219 Transcript_23442/m.39219 type:complete len:391 (-) Transcript_23442:139-1311(-)|eukprot:CAMPEP_0198213832 /NCGR_PEP_ID=MMETSP1445-20131203/34020_1 /TAXON_ID=36898 /ORGANISM="Pyramimonas sp., Strain CCMP2087" /LENGTH=390 /DNA_ID=CAMNT_0043888649 /DNA_START=121 /DNA_END=1293 /DNA_ORIENTATION=-